MVQAAAINEAARQLGGAVQLLARVYLLSLCSYLGLESSGCTSITQVGRPGLETRTR
jgi:hypothetical protein